MQAQWPLPLGTEDIGSGPDGLAWAVSNDEGIARARGRRSLPWSSRWPAQAALDASTVSQDESNGPRTIRVDPWRRL